MLSGKRCERNLHHLCTGGLDGIELAHQRMRGGDFVVAISADQYEVLCRRADQQVFQHVERRRVEPSQIVEEDPGGCFGCAKTPTKRLSTN
jgi:hypothetical protein